MNRHVFYLAAILTLLVFSGVIAVVRPLRGSPTAPQEGPFISKRMMETLRK